MLMAVGGAACGVDPSPEELQQARQQVAAAGQCQVRPQPSFEPELEWKWDGSRSVLPDYRQVMMTPAVVDLNGDHIPDVVFAAFSGDNYFSGVLRAINGADGSDLWTVTNDDHRVRGAANLAAGDIDHDGKPEICALSAAGIRVFCFEHDGTFKFGTAPSHDRGWGGVSFADLEGDGNVEILQGSTVYTHTGALRWDHSRDNDDPPAGALSFAADLDGDGIQEVINGRAVYHADGTLKCRNLDAGPGLAGVGNFDQDPQGEIVVVWEGNVWLLDDDCTKLRSGSLTGLGPGGPPNIEDFDNDGQPEIGVAGGDYYTVFDTNLTPIWKVKNKDRSSRRTGSSSFDFEGDGKAEVVYADEEYLRIYDGASGEERFKVPNSSGTAYENPVIVDVDGDNNAEIVVVSNDYHFPGQSWATAGIRVFRDKNDGWVNTRRIWNQHAYSITNVNEDGSIPRHPAPNWRVSGLNTFRAQDSVTNPFAAPDLVTSEVTAACDRPSETLTLSARVTNQGEAATSANLKVAFFRGNPASGGTLLGVYTHPSVLLAGASTVATIQLRQPPGGVADLFVVADNDGTGVGRERECNETNNTATASLDLTCVANLPPVALCRDLTVSADASCQGHGEVNNGSYDPDQSPEPLTLSYTPAGPYSLGSHPITLTAFDGMESDQCVGTITVVDDTPPVPGPEKGLVLWPPNHKYRLLTLAECAAPAQDQCGGTLPLEQYGRITRVTSDEVEDDNGNGDGHTCDDMIVGVGTTAVQLRAEREGTGDGRVYTVHYTVTDPAGNAAQGTCRVSVPHDQSGSLALDSGPKYCVGQGCPGDLGGSPSCQ